MTDDGGSNQQAEVNRSPVWLVITVLGNVIGGALLLSGMFALPHVLAEILG